MRPLNVKSIMLLDCILKFDTFTMEIQGKLQFDQYTSTRLYGHYYKGVGLHSYLAESFQSTPFVWTENFWFAKFGYIKDTF